ncbi:non-ribosomal peptide synthetase, partial [Streptacidiphilus albus]|uniref:non-ribosomal peptide synthetase n=1 Tax=Streptacidiphilus albus TaxID=105425 RepID=UPI001F2F5108
MTDHRLAYWKQTLAGLEPLELRTDRRRSGSPLAGGTIAFDLPSGLAGRLTRIAADRGADLSVALLSAYQLLLARYTGRQDVAVRAGVIVRTDLAGDPAFTGLVDQVRDVLAAAGPQQLPLAQLAEAFPDGCDLRRHPAFALRRADGGSVLTGGAEGAEDAELALEVTETAEGLHATLRYRPGLFERPAAQRLVGHLRTLLAAAAAEPGARLSELDMLTESERRQILVEWNDTAGDFADTKTVHQLVEERAALHPEAVALSTGTGELSYRALNERANLLAHHLLDRGIGRGSLVAVCLDRSPDMICALLGILKSGAAYIPLDPDYPAERLAYMLADSAAPLVVTDTRLAQLLPGSTPRLLTDRDWPTPADQPADDPAPAATAQDLAYVIYTSGSTGRPKGVQIQHQGVVNLIQWTVGNFGMRPADRVALLAGVGFDAAVWELWPALAAGATCCITPDTVRTSPPLLQQWLQDQSIRGTFVPTPMLEALIALPWSADSSLEYLLTGGDQLHLPEEGALPFRVVNNYGPTECTVLVTSAGTTTGESLPLIGAPITNCTVYVVDRHNRAVPVGVPGELLIGGAGLARGYLNRPELTEARFVAHPFSTEPGARVYRTGDLVSWSPDGQLEFLGRIDDQVKLRGYRIELGEIEATLLTHPGVGAAVVTVREDTPGDKRLAAYLVPADETAPTIGDLRAHLLRDLPGHMVPASFTTLDRLPLTPNGKIDRRALPAPDHHRPDLDSGYAAPTTATEAAVTAIWCEVLGIDSLGVHDNFFELGGHSLLATRVTSRLRQDLGVDLPVRALFDAPTPALLAAAVGGADAGAGLGAITPAPRTDGPLPLSFAQQRLWFLDQLAPGSAEYVIPFGLRVRGPLDTAVLETALSALVARHEILRTRFVADEDGRPQQIVDGPWPVAAGLHDLRGVGDDAERESAARRLLETEAVRPFDLATGPLLRAVLARIADEDHYLLVTVHHIVADGWSEGILARELHEHYAAALEQRGARLPALPVQYADFSVRQREWLAGDLLDRQLGYWRGVLTGLEPLELPTDRRRPPVRSSDGGVLTFTVPEELTGRLRSTATGSGASLFMTLLSVFQLLLSKYSGQEDIAVGTPIAGRNRAEIEDMIGFFVNTLVMRTDLSGDPTFTELLDRVKDTALGAYDHQDLPFERLVEELAPDRDLSRNPLFQTMFVLQNTPDAHTWSLPGLTVEPIGVEAQDAKFDLTLFLTEQRDGSLGGTLVYATDLFDGPTVERVAGHFQTLLAAVAATPQARLSELELLTAAERQQILVDWNDTATDYPETSTVHRLFEQRVAVDPDTVAVRDGGRSLTYRRLNERANQLAHQLRTQGVGPGALVAVCLDRSPELICALLGVLKAGAAYVPLDPDHPADRLGYMVEDSSAPVVITRSEHADRLPATTPRLLIDQDWAVVARQPVTDPEPWAGPEDLAYTIYTSGSTGRPKGVQIEHRSLGNLVHWTATTFAIAPGDRVALLAGVGFDAAAWELWPALAAGATCCITTDTVRLTPALLQQWLQEQGIRGTFVPTPMLEALAALPWDSTTSLDYVLTGGDQLHLPADSPLPFRVYNNYGPTEATVLVTSTEVTPGDPVPPIGRPVANSSVYLVDRHDRPVPVGIPGELLIGGAGLARGYLNQPELSRERFTERV